jgi:hypothetical protein
LAIVNSRVSKALSIALGVAVMATVAWLLYFVVSRAVTYFGSLQSQVATAIVAGAATIAVAFISATVGKALENRATIVRDIRTKKVPVYEDLIDVIFRFFYEDKVGSKMSERQKVDALAKVQQRLIVWASDDVVHEFGQFRSRALAVAGDPAKAPATMFALEDLLLAIRRDLGHSNKKIARGDLLRFFINDVDKHIAPGA